MSNGTAIRYGNCTVEDHLHWSRFRHRNSHRSFGDRGRVNFGRGCSHDGFSRRQIASLHDITCRWLARTPVAVYVPAGISESEAEQSSGDCPSTGK